MGAFISGLIVEVVFVLCVLNSEELKGLFELNGMGDWVIYSVEDSGVFSKEVMGVAALYSYGVWLVIVTGWSLLIGVIVVLEVTRGG